MTDLRISRRGRQQALIAFFGYRQVAPPMRRHRLIVERLKVHAIP
jgi:hypothetical protein